jgi:hypothetical protein
MKRQKKLTREDGYRGKEGNQVEKIGGKAGEVFTDSNGVTKVRSKQGKARKLIPDDTKKEAIEAARIGIPFERIAILCGFYGNDSDWHRWLAQEPEFSRDLQRARVSGEVMMQRSVLNGENGWQGSAWTLERRHGCVARQQLEHSGPGGKALTIAHQVLAAVQHGERA